MARRGDRSTSFDKDSSRPTSHVENTLQRHLSHHIARAQHDIIQLYIDYVITISILSQSVTCTNKFKSLHTFLTFLLIICSLQLCSAVYYCTFISFLKIYNKIYCRTRNKSAIRNFLTNFSMPTKIYILIS